MAMEQTTRGGLQERGGLQGEKDRGRLHTHLITAPVAHLQRVLAFVAMLEAHEATMNLREVDYKRGREAAREESWREIFFTTLIGMTT